MAKVTIFDPKGESHRFISDVSAFLVKDGLLTANYIKNKARITIRTTLPFFIEESEPIDTKD